MSLCMVTRRVFGFGAKFQTLNLPTNQNPFTQTAKLTFSVFFVLICCQEIHMAILTVSVYLCYNPKALGMILAHYRLCSYNRKRIHKI